MSLSWLCWAENRFCRWAEPEEETNAGVWEPLSKVQLGDGTGRWWLWFPGEFSPVLGVGLNGSLTGGGACWSPRSRLPRTKGQLLKTSWRHARGRVLMHCRAVKTSVCSDFQESGVKPSSRVCHWLMYGWPIAKRKRKPDPEEGSKEHYSWWAPPSN